MVDLEYWKEKALECGFSHVGELDVDTIELRKEARDACAENKCHNYGKNWSCPPGCGTLEECDAMIRKFKRGLLVQTTGEIDSLDFDGFMELGKNHGTAMKKFAELVRSELPGAMVMAAKKRTAAEVMAEIVQDRAYYRDSGGGVTLSGGEVFCQKEFADALVSACAAEKIPVAAETNLYWEFDEMRPVLEKLDLVMFDLKLADPEAHRRWTGADNARALRFYAKNAYHPDGFRSSVWIKET